MTDTDAAIALIADPQTRHVLAQLLARLETTVSRLDLTLEEHVGALDHTPQLTHADLVAEIKGIRAAIDDLIFTAAGVDHALADATRLPGRVVQRHVEEYHAREI